MDMSEEQINQPGDEDERSKAGENEDEKSKETK